MTIARNQQICLDSTPYYHCYNRCVRRAYLRGKDPLTQKDYDHRQEWIKEILLKLTDSFCIEVTAYSVMPKQYDVVVKIAPDQASTLTDFDVIDRRSQIYTISSSAHYFRQGYTLTDLQSQTLKADLTHWRAQLVNLSRFMGYLNEKIARQANKEDDLTGRFWESRFSSRAIFELDAFLLTNNLQAQPPSPTGGVG